MAVKKGGLGRGLESLFEDAARDVGGPVSTLPLREIEPDKDQPRKDFDEQALSELADSIARHGLPAAHRGACGGRRSLQNHRRRAPLAGSAPCGPFGGAGGHQGRDRRRSHGAWPSSRTSAGKIWTRWRRPGLPPADGAVRADPGADSPENRQEPQRDRQQPASSEPADDVLAFLKEGKLSTGHAKVLLGLPDAALMKQAAEAVVGQNLNVRQTEALCKKLAKPQKPPKPQPLRPALAGEVEYALREVLGSEVKVDYKNGQGSLTVHFYSDEQLSAFANLLGGYNKEENK